MKHLITLIIVAFTPLAHSETANEFFKKGETALQIGDIKTAKAAYQNALKVDPQHGNSKYRLASMKELTATASVTARKVKMAKIIIPEVNIEEATLEESLEILGSLIEKESDEKFIANFVVSDPEKILADKSLTLRLRNTPATVIFDYLLAKANARASWGAHVIGVRPLNNASAKKPATTPTQEAKK